MRRRLPRADGGLARLSPVEPGNLETGDVVSVIQDEDELVRGSVQAVATEAGRYSVEVADADGEVYTCWQKAGREFRLLEDGPAEWPIGAVARHLSGLGYQVSREDRETLHVIEDESAPASLRLRGLEFLEEQGFEREGAASAERRAGAIYRR
jgi:hypothetical protein